MISVAPPKSCVVYTEMTETTKENPTFGVNGEVGMMLLTTSLGIPCILIRLVLKL